VMELQILLTLLIAASTVNGQQTPPHIGGCTLHKFYSTTLCCCGICYGLRSVCPSVFPSVYTNGDINANDAAL